MCRFHEILSYFLFHNYSELKSGTERELSDMYEIITLLYIIILFKMHNGKCVFK